MVKVITYSQVIKFAPKIGSIDKVCPDIKPIVMK